MSSISTIVVCEAQVPFVWGGAEVLVRELVSQFRRHGYQTELVSVPFKWYPRDEILSRPFTDLVGTEERRRLLQLFLRLSESNLLRDTFLFQRGDGTHFDGELSGRRLSDGGFQIVIRDITQRKDFERQLLEYQEKLRTMAHRATIEDERQRRSFASDLHDSVGQTLALAHMRLGMVGSAAPEALRPEVDKCLALLEEAEEQVRKITFDLSPPILYDLGLVPAMEWLAETMGERYHLRVTVEGDRVTTLDPSRQVLASFFLATLETVGAHRSLFLFVSSGAGDDMAERTLHLAPKRIRPLDNPSSRYSLQIFCGVCVDRRALFASTRRG